jgi:hypothetical protein
MQTLRPRVIGRVLLALLVSTGCRASIATPPCADRGSVSCTTDGIRVLFIGNSLTYGNDVPAIVRALAAEHGGARIRTTTVAFPNMSLDDHWRDGTARRALQAGRWDVVVLQQGPSSLPESRALLIAACGRFAPLIRAAGARAILFEVWPSTARRSDAAAVQRSYRDAARAIGGTVAPAGSAWTAALTANPRMTLYDTDGLHAATPGSVLAALALYARIADRAIDSTGSLPVFDGDATLTAQLRRAVRTALAAEPGS